MSTVDRIDRDTAIDAVIALFLKTFRTTFTADDASAWRPVFQASVASFSGEDIRQGAFLLLRDWRKRDAPKPADLADAIGRMQGERRVAKPLAIEAPAAQPCRCCGGHGSLNFYKRDGDGWLKQSFACQCHVVAWRNDIRRQGWRSLMELTPSERLEIYPAPAFKRGTIGAAISTQLDEADLRSRQKLKAQLEAMAAE